MSCDWSNANELASQQIQCPCNANISTYITLCLLSNSGILGLIFKCNLTFFFKGHSMQIVRCDYPLHGMRLLDHK